MQRGILLTRERTGLGVTQARGWRGLASIPVWTKLNITSMENTADIIGPLPLGSAHRSRDWTVADPDDGWWWSGGERYAPAAATSSTRP